MSTLMLAEKVDFSWYVIGGGALLLVMTFIWVVTKWIVVGNPSEMLVISGKGGDGHGYRILIGGRTIVVPILEKVSRLSLKNMQVGLEVKAQAGGGTMIPVSVNGVANVKVASDPDIRGNAIERFLDQPLGEMQRVARETLEGGLRAVIGKMTPEEIVEDRDKFVSTLVTEVTDDIRKLGLLIDSVNIQNVHDEEQYLESIARKASAQVRATARQYEAERKAEADIKEAEALALSRKAQAERDAEAKSAESLARQTAEQARIDADKKIAESENALQIRKIELTAEQKIREADSQALARQGQATRDAEARTAEAVSRQKAEGARISADKSIAEADNDLRVRKAELVREASLKEAERNKAAAEAEAARLAATDVARANAARDVAMARAAGDAATILEEGKARAAAIEQIGRTIQQHPDALKVMLVEMMPNVVDQLTKTIANVKLGDVTVIDGGRGDAMAGAAMGRAKMLAESLGVLEGVTGVDMKELVSGIAANIVDRPKAANTAAATTPKPAKKDD
ncbi:MAG TPA: SPFH domain-containing protein [Phycisphaerae bacterium]|nr:SPFH domain-containing protein [Phycisphaerae bacterium]HRW55764.1 SPFH domain-containing protein [Phycisphaerae bacterium]